MRRDLLPGALRARTCRHARRAPTCRDARGARALVGGRAAALGALALCLGLSAIAATGSAAWASSGSFIDSLVDSAQEEARGWPPDGVGPETGLPLPRYVSLKATRANVRRGPGMTHRVDWVFVRRGMPLQVIAEYGHWRRVRDPEGAAGWVHYSMLRGNRTALVTSPRIDLHLEPGETSPVAAHAERGVVFEVDACQRDWCEVEKDGVAGWVAKTDLWGVSAEEVFD